MMLRDRKDAGRRLAEHLMRYRGQPAVVLALPRGGVIVGFEIARALGLPLDIVVTRKVGHPTNPEYAVCAVDEDGRLLCNEIERASLNAAWLKQETKRQQEEAGRRSSTYRNGRNALDIEGKTVIITDDGIATGLTMRLAIAGVKARKPSRIVVAVPVAPEDSVRTIRPEVDEFVVLEPPEEFLGAVGSHYIHFDQVEDEEVVRLMA